MRAAGAAVCLALAAAATTSCAYYNGLYNANRLTKAAAKAEREGRESEARALWSQAAVKAESVVARYPGSRYRDDALLVWGRALRSVGECGGAIEPLARAFASTPDSAIRLQSGLLLGLCYHETGRYQDADSVLSAFVNSPDSSVVISALHLRGRARLAAGMYREAARDLAACGLAEAQLPLALAYAYQRQRHDAERVLLAAPAEEADEDQWVAVLDTIGGFYPDLAAAVVDRLSQRAELSSDMRALVLRRDGERWLAFDGVGTAARRFQQVIALAPATHVAAIAQVELIQAELRLAASVRQLPGMLEQLRAVALDDEDAIELRYPELLADLQMAVAGLDAPSAAATREALPVGGPDLDLFMAAEALREEWSAASMAVALLSEIPRRYPSSAIAPKALLAAAWLDTTRADSLLAVLHRDYPSSPYTLVLRGTSGERYTALEDSLRALLEARRKSNSPW